MHFLVLLKQGVSPDAHKKTASVCLFNLLTPKGTRASINAEEDEEDA